MKLSILAGVASLSCLALVAACSSSSNKGSGGGGDGGSSSGGEGGGGDSGSSSGGGSLPYFGAMTASRTVAGATTIYTISGGFFATPDVSIPDASAAATCPTAGTVSGSCCFVPPAAPSDAGASDAGATFSFVSAGAITFKDGTAAIAALNPGTNGAYGISSANNPSVKWQPGDTLAVSAAGSAVKSFTGNLVTVQDFAGVTPALSYTTPATVPITADFAVKWTPGSASTVRLFVDAVKGTAQVGSIACDVADSAGSATVPAALLSKLTTGDGGVITLTRATVTPATDGNATVDLLSTVTTGGTAKFQ